MPLKEAIRIEEQVTVFIRDKDGTIRTYRVKTPWDKKPLKEKILTILGFLKEPGTMTDIGKANCAILYGGAAGTGYKILYVGSSYTGTAFWKTATIGYTTATGILTYSNESYPWTQVGTWSSILLGPAALADSAQYHSITKSITTSTGISWWVQVQLTISGT